MKKTLVNLALLLQLPSYLRYLITFFLTTSYYLVANRSFRSYYVRTLDFQSCTYKAEQI